MIQIPISQVPNQTLQVIINNQVVTITIQTRQTLGQYWTYMDISVGGNYIVAGIQCTTLPIIPYDYLSDYFAGNFIFVNTDGSDNPPAYTSFNDTQLLIFYNDSDIA